ncbi:Magnesium-transporting ATPase, P-type 1 [bacterium HR37]|nr:Magnesium-transporting ATPase, P-type 1 [bacterium HR37]
MKQEPLAFWSLESFELLKQLETTPQGLTDGEAKKRLLQFGPNLLKSKKRLNALMLLGSQFKSPIVIMLILASVLSLFLGDPTEALIILVIVLVSGLLGFWQEKGAVDAVQKLLAIVQVKATVLRNGSPTDVPVEEIVPGDIVVLNAGDVIPGDCFILEAKDLFVNEATLTGETYPVEKTAGILKVDTPLSQRTNSLFIGTHVVSGTAKAVVVRTGVNTEFGKVAQRLKLRPPETEFEQGVKQFGYFLMEVTFILVIAIFAINVYLKRPILDSFLFSLALAVGLTPQLLPAIISINLAHGAKRMALEKVIVKRLASIENLGSMNVLCSDKTGTLTQGVMKLNCAIDVEGNESEKVLLLAYINAFFQSGFTNPIDDVIRTNYQFDMSRYRKLDEVPYDFIRKRLSILVSRDNTNIIVTKGALPNVLSVCSLAETSDGKVVDLNTIGEQIQSRFEDLSNRGFRTLGVAYRVVGSKSVITKEDETMMTFVGFLIFSDPLKPGVTETVKKLKELGITLKIITGDNHLVAASISEQVGLLGQRIITGSQIRNMSDEALIKRAGEVDVFAEVEPNQKEQIIRALRKSGNVVGYLGDGINDTSALHTADVGISVDSAVDVAKEAADIVLLKMDLGVLVEGVREGRVTFANTLKYVFMATSANFGNMFSMAGASLFLSFLPLLPKQVLLTNLLTDLPEITIATDSVDSELIERPRQWNIRFIRDFMATFGILSSVFDYVTFGVLISLLHATQEQFRTGWFIESVISASIIVLVIRTRRPFFKSLPGRYLLIMTFLVVIVTLLLPWTPVAKIFGFQPLPASFLYVLGLIVLLYVIAAEMTKIVFYNRTKNPGPKSLRKDFDPG